MRAPPHPTSGLARVCLSFYEMVGSKERGLGVKSAKLISLDLPEFGLWSMEPVGQLIENGENTQRREMSGETRQAL